MESYLQIDGTWAATIWIVREFYFAEGKTEEAAITNLKEHLKNTIPIYENDIQVAQEKIATIKKISENLLPCPFTCVEM